MVDPLEAFNNLETCPKCGCLTQVGAMRCPECGTFHSDLDSLPDRDPPPPTVEPPKPKDLDPSLYSQNPHAELPEEVEEEEPETAPTIGWGESSTDFTFDDSSDIASIKERAESDSEDSKDVVNDFVKLSKPKLKGKSKQLGKRLKKRSSNDDSEGFPDHN
jgi:hypothetical protein